MFFFYIFNSHIRRISIPSVISDYLWIFIIDVFNPILSIFIIIISIFISIIFHTYSDSKNYAITNIFAFIILLGTIKLIIICCLEIIKKNIKEKMRKRNKRD